LGFIHQNCHAWCPDLKSRRTLGIRFASVPPKGHGCSVERAAGLHSRCSTVTPKSPDIAARTSTGLTWFDEVAGRPRPKCGTRSAVPKNRSARPVDRTAQLTEACVAVLPGGFRSRAPKCSFALPVGLARQLRRTALVDPVGVIAPEHKCSVARPWVQPFRSRRTVGPLPGLRFQRTEVRVYRSPNMGEGRVGLPTPTANQSSWPGMS